MDELILKYRSLGVLLDTNILLLHLIGSLNRDYVASFKRTQTFALEDFDTLQLFLGRFSIFSTTPNVMTEVSNLVDKIDEGRKEDFNALFAEHITLLREHYVETASISGNAYFSRVGVTDSGIIEAARNKYLVITDDWELTQQLATESIDVINFNHLRIWAQDI